MSVQDGGPAFPRAASTDEHHTPANVYQDQQGMSLRDWFAGQALQGLLADGAQDCDLEEDIAHTAVTLADALIAALAAREPSDG